MAKIKNLNLNSLFYLAGFLFVLTETILNIYDKSLCTTEGCRIVESFIKGEALILLISGLFLFGMLFFISIYKFTQKIKPTIEYIHSGILIVALSVEGYLLGFQTFIIKEFCLFCLTVFGILFVSSLFRLLEKRFELSLAFASFVSVFLMTYFVNPEINQIPSHQYILIYSKECSQCEEVIQFCKAHSISIQAVEASRLSGTLKSLKIEHIPVLFCDEGTIKKFILGQYNIKEYLLSKASKTNSEEGVCPIFDKQRCQ